MARYTLASYAVRDAGLREYLRNELARQPAPIKAPLGEVIEAADTVQLVRSARMRSPRWKNSKPRARMRGAPRLLGPSRRRRGRAGLRLAAALGQVAVGIPCVIGGSASQGLLSFWEKQQQ